MWEKQPFSIISQQNSSTFSWKRWCSTRCFYSVSRRSRPACRILCCTSHFLEVRTSWSESRELLLHHPPGITPFTHSRLPEKGWAEETHDNHPPSDENPQEPDPTFCRSRIRSDMEFLTERWILAEVQESLQPSATQMLQESHPPTTLRRLFFDSPAHHDSPV